jgi:rhodanese-related sulfurtransferase
MLSFSSSSPAGVSRIAPRDAVAKAASRELIVIDVRESAEIAASGMAEGALHVPLALLKMRCDRSSPECLAELAIDKPVALYCASGGRSQMAAQALAAMGYREVYNIGGLGDWISAGGKVSR